MEDHINAQCKKSGCEIIFCCVKVRIKCFEKDIVH